MPKQFHISKMEISLKDIPEYLKKSELYRNLLENSDDENDKILINPIHNRKDININSFKDLCIYLDIYRYWLIDDFIKELFYDYVKNNEINIDYLKDNFHELDLIDEFKQIKIFDVNSCCFAAENGKLDFLKYLRKNNCAWDVCTCLRAASTGHLDCLKYAHENGCPWDEYICHKAAQGGHLDCLRYAHENGCPWNMWTCNYAAEDGNLDCLIYCHINGCHWKEDTCFYAASNNKLDCLKYAHEN